MSAAFRAILILLLIVTSHGLAAARGQARAVGEQVICAGGELITVAVDDQGQPVRRVLICPDMALNLMSAVAALPAQPDLSETVWTLPFDAALSAGIGREAMEAQARGPPLPPA
ncbi:MAG: hypothetical protein ACK5LJ_18610 [Paracoccus sp. (in: a-proteobacteria)]